MTATKLFAIFTITWLLIAVASYNGALHQFVALGLTTISAWACGSVFWDMKSEITNKDK